MILADFPTPPENHPDAARPRKYFSFSLHHWEQNHSSFQRMHHWAWHAHVKHETHYRPHDLATCVHTRHRLFLFNALLKRTLFCPNHHVYTYVHMRVNIKSCSHTIWPYIFYQSINHSPPFLLIPLPFYGHIGQALIQYGCMRTILLEKHINR